MKQCVAILLALTMLSVKCLAEEPEYRYVSDYSSVAELKAAGLSKAQEVEEEGVVLLKNESDILPLNQESRISLFGVTSIDPVYGGTGSGAVETDSAADFVASMENAGLKVMNTELLSWYKEQKEEENLGRTSHAIGEGKWSKVKKYLGENFEQIRDTDAVYVLGRVGGEGSDMTKGADKNDAGEDYLTLNEEEQSVLFGLKELKDEGIIRSISVIVNSANPISSAFLFDDAYSVDAALWVGSLGQTGVMAVGRCMAGTVNPSGSLPDTWWMDNMQNPVMNNFTPQIYENVEEYFLGGSYYQYTRYVVYQEGIYVGYRYTETRYEDVETAQDGAGEFDYETVVAYPFGYGLSYTDFALSNMQVEKVEAGRKTSYRVTVDVMNTGSMAGKKTVQVYVQKPYTEYDRENSIEKASVELVGYAKTALLQPNEMEHLTIDVPEYYLTSYDAENSEAFILSEGVYSLICAENAHDAAVRVIAARKEPEEQMAVSAADPLVWCINQTFDDTTYADSYGTGEMVSSLFSFADINRYDGAEDNETTYYSRSNWEDTVTEESVKLAMTDLMAADLELGEDGLPEDDEFPIMGADNGLVLADLFDAEEDDPIWEQFMDQLTFEELETLCLTGLRETAEIDRIGKPSTVDHNGPTGVTQKYNYDPDGNGYAVVFNDPDNQERGTCYPCNGILAATFNDALIKEVGELVGEDAMWAGYSGIYGTGLNLHRSAYAGRVFEYFSEDPILTGLMGAAWSSGVQSKGVYVYSKHMALNEQEENRAGLGTWCNEQALRELYLRAFELPIVYADAKCVMSAFNRLGATWCGASAELMTEWLRNEAGMDGFAVTDMYDSSYMVMANALVAGNDIPDGELIPTGYTLKTFAEDGERPNSAVVKAMRKSAKRVLYTVLHSRGMDGTATLN